jgi:hypothetical protein
MTQLERSLSAIVAMLVIYISVVSVFLYLDSLNTLEDAPQVIQGELTDYRPAPFGSHRYRVKINGSHVGHVVVSERLDGHVVLVVKPN